ncbi:hypothetical protein RvY_11916 [Ramazzottius varieornatus]|uniref:BED-type domain-containing protein n=1 Tax=Ramazzottius varieornatus TaxID=947166 RepID=A0A1D1VQE0_RAMVA|nr:hypothetical protein RvY_11916 [Ramazzottius varieornatus]
MLIAECEAVCFSRFCFALSNAMCVVSVRIAEYYEDNSMAGKEESCPIVKLKRAADKDRWESEEVTKGAAVSPAIIDTVSSDEGSESSDDAEAPSTTLSLALFTKPPPEKKRERSGEPKKKSTLWSFYVSDEEKGTTTCLACTYVTPDGHTGSCKPSEKQP